MKFEVRYSRKINGRTDVSCWEIEALDLSEAVYIVSESPEGGDIDQADTVTINKLEV